MRGVSPMAFEVRQGVKIVEGRTFTPGLYELVVGKKAGDRYEGAQIGGTIKLQRRSWTVVGVFSSRGQRLRERDLGRRRGDGARRSTAPAATSR